MKDWPESAKWAVFFSFLAGALFVNVVFIVADSLIPDTPESRFLP